MFLFCCEGAEPKSPSFNADSDQDELDFGGAELSPSFNHVIFQKTAQFKREPRSTEPEVVKSYVEVSSSAEDSGSVSSGSCGTSFTERRTSFPTEPEECGEDEWSPRMIAFYYKVLNSVGKSLKKSLQNVKVDTAWCITQPSCIKEYVRGLIYTEATPECYLIGVLYLERFLRDNPQTPLTASNVQLLYLTALTVAIKYVDDSYFNSQYYAKIGGVQDVRTLNRLELKFLFGLNFDLMVDQEQYRMIEKALMGTQLQTKRRRTNSGGNTLPLI